MSASTSCTQSSTLGPLMNDNARTVLLNGSNINSCELFIALYILNSRRNLSLCLLSPVKISGSLPRSAPVSAAGAAGCCAWPGCCCCAICAWCCAPWSVQTLGGGTRGCAGCTGSSGFSKAGRGGGSIPLYVAPETWSRYDG